MVVEAQPAGRAGPLASFFRRQWRASIRADAAALAELVSRLLRKDASDRPQSATEALNGLESPRFAPAGVKAQIGNRRYRLMFAGLLILGLRAAAMVFYGRQAARQNKINSLVVLPFVDSSANADAEYLSDGITEGLINSLSQVPELRVIARTTAFRYRGKRSIFGN